MIHEEIFYLSVHSGVLQRCQYNSMSTYKKFLKGFGLSNIIYLISIRINSLMEEIKVNETIGTKLGEVKIVKMELVCVKVLTIPTISQEKKIMTL